MNGSKCNRVWLQVVLLPFLTCVVRLVYFSDAFTFNPLLSKIHIHPIVATRSPFQCATRRNFARQGVSSSSWDNDNFLNALSHGATSLAVQKANEEYHQQSQITSEVRRRQLERNLGSGTSLLATSKPKWNSFGDSPEGEEGTNRYNKRRDDDEDMKGSDDDESNSLFGNEIQGMPNKLLKKPAPIDEENPMGGQMFRKMLERAQGAAAGLNPPMKSLSANQQSQLQSQSQQQSPISSSSSNYYGLPQESSVMPVTSAFPPQQPPAVPSFPTVPYPTAVPGSNPYSLPTMPLTTTTSGMQGQPVAQPQLNMMPQQPSPNIYVDPQQAYYQAQLQLWQQQMMAFAQFSAANPQAAASMTMPPPPPPPLASASTMPSGQGSLPYNYYYGQPQPQVYPPSPPQLQPQQQQEQQQMQPSQSLQSEQESNRSKSIEAFLPKAPSGRANRDAYDIVNSADLYLAQLKRDSTVRALARKAGDVSTANKPFADEGVQALKNFFTEELEGHRKTSREKANDLFTTSRDEMIFPIIEENLDEATKQERMKDAGISYKKLLEQKKKSKLQNEPKASNDNDNLIDKVDHQSHQGASQAHENSYSPVIAEKVPIETVKSEAFSSNVASPIEVKESQVPVMESLPTVSLVSEANTKPTTEPLLVGGTESDENRRLIRTLMGLILKHRGGTGFGSGRLKAPEDKRLEESFEKVLNLLKAESSMGNASFESGSHEAIPSASVTESSSSSVTAATFNNGDAHSQLLTGVFACLEAVIGMYKSSPPEQQDELLMPLRDAFMSAVNTVNKVIAEKEVLKVDALASESGPVRTTTEETVVAPTSMDFPDFYYEAETYSEISVVEEENIVDEEDNYGTNSSRLQETYDALKLFQGDEKFGLKKMTSNEASRLSNILSDMREVLMDELKTADSSTSSDSPALQTEKQTFTTTQPNTMTNPGTSSKYSQMLAKSKADKAAKRSEQ